MDGSLPWRPPYGYIEVRREPGGVGVLLSWRVYVNGEHRERVRRHEAVSVMVEAGEHLVQVCGGLSASRLVEVDVPEGRRVLLVARPRRWNPWPEATPLARTRGSTPLRNVRIDLQLRR